MRFKRSLKLKKLTSLSLNQECPGTVGFKMWKRATLENQADSVSSRHPLPKNWKRLILLTSLLKSCL